MELGSKSLRRVAVIGRGTAGSLAAAAVARLHPDPDHELHHIYDSRIPTLGVGEGTWPSLLPYLEQLTNLSDETIQQSVNGTRKYGLAFEGWGVRNRDFIHSFIPENVSYGYHLCADLMGELLRKSANARHIDAKVLDITRVDGGALVECEGMPPERYDLVFDARGFPRELDPDRHINIPFIPTNTAIIRRCPAIVEEEGDGPVLQHTYTRSIARPHGWVAVIPLTTHTAYGYIFDRDITSPAEVEADFDALLESDGVAEFEPSAVIQFPNFIHRQIYDGTVCRIGNAAAFVEPLQATTIAAAQLQIGMILQTRLHRPVERIEHDTPTVNQFLVKNMLYYGLFVGWHYHRGSKFESAFWRHARDYAWPQHRDAAAPEIVDCDALQMFDEMLYLLKQSEVDKSDHNQAYGFSLGSFIQMSQGLGC